MKRFLTMLLALFMVSSVLVLSACSSKEDVSDSRYVGKWKAYSVGFMEETKEMDEEWYLILNADATGKLTAEGEEKDITWSLTDSGFKTKGGAKLTFRDDGDRIKTSFLGVEIVFEKDE